MNNDIKTQGNDFDVVYKDDVTLIEKLKELDVAGDKATQGKWEITSKNIVKPSGYGIDSICKQTEFGVAHCQVSNMPEFEENAQFIATAANNRATIKDAIAALEKQARDNGELKIDFEKVRQSYLYWKDLYEKSQQRNENLTRILSRLEIEREEQQMNLNLEQTGEDNE